MFLPQQSQRGRGGRRLCDAGRGSPATASSNEQESESRCHCVPTSVEEEERRDQAGVNIETLADERTQHVVVEGNFRPDWEGRRSRDPLRKSIRVRPSHSTSLSLCVLSCRCDLTQSLIFFQDDSEAPPSSPSNNKPRTNQLAIYRNSVKQKDSKNKRANFLPQTTIQPVSRFTDRQRDREGGIESNWRTEEEMEINHLATHSPQLFPSLNI